MREVQSRSCWQRSQKQALERSLLALDRARNGSTDGDPTAVDEQFYGPILGLVAHLFGVANPVAEIDVGQAERLA